MKKEVVFPKLSSKALSGIVIEWASGLGETVNKGEILYSVETDKAVHEIESPFSGVLESIHVDLGDAVTAGDLVAVIKESEVE